MDYDEFCGKIFELTERVRDMRSRLSMPEEFKYRNEFKNLGRAKYGYRILSTGEKQKCAGLEHTMHAEVRQYFSDMNALVGEINKLPDDQSIQMMKNILVILKLPFDTDFIPEWKVFINQVGPLLSK